MAEEILQVTLHSLNINFDLSEQISDIKKLGNLTKLISSNLNLSNVIKELLGAGMEITGVNHTSILLIDPDKMAKGMAYEMYRYDPELHTYYSTARMTRGIAHRVITTKKPVLVENLKKMGGEDIQVVVGGVIPRVDYDFLYKAGAAAIFGPGTPIIDSANKVLNVLEHRK